ncbi:MAG: DKNYY domain-containing protein, partial [Myxococcota bacterium]
MYSILETKLKPLKQADPGSFRALHDRFGLDDHNAFYREKRLRGVALRSFRALGPDHAIDETHLHCGIEKLKVPDGIDIARARLRTLVDHWNPPQIAFALTDGTKTWVNVFSLAHDWCVCEGADFDQLRMLGDLYHADHHRVWYTGQIVGGIDASQARVLERFTIADDTHVWHRTELLDLTPTELAPVGVGDFHGDLFHYGDRLVVHEPNGETQTVARAPVVRTFNATDTLRPIFETLWLIFDRYLPILTSADDMEVPFDPSQRAEHHVDRPPFHAELDDSGMIHVRSNGTELNGHVTAWYTLASQLYCVIAGRPPECMHYPSVGRMLPDGQAVHKRVMRHHFDEFGALVRECGRRALIEATEFLSHFLMGRVLFHYRSAYRGEEDPILRVIATLPQALMRESYFIPKHFEFESTTNLSVARFIVREGHLDSDDFRDRLD